MADDEDARVRDEFHDAVNMTASELEEFLGTDASKSVGQKKSGNAESTGHESGREIVAVLGKKTSELDEDDYHQM